MGETYDIADAYPLECPNCETVEPHRSNGRLTKCCSCGYTGQE